MHHINYNLTKIFFSCFFLLLNKTTIRQRRIFLQESEPCVFRDWAVLSFLSLLQRVRKQLIWSPPCSCSQN